MVGGTLAVLCSAGGVLHCCAFAWQLTDSQYKLNYLIGAGDSGISFGLNVRYHREVTPLVCFGCR